MVTVAFYKGHTRVFNKLVSWWTRGPYSHTELVVDGVWYSSSFLDGGVRAKRIEFDPEHWDLIELPDADAASAVKWFEDHAGLKYDVLGLAGFVIRSLPDDRRKYFCSESVAASLGFDEAWRLDPNTFAAVLRRMAGQKK